MRHDVRDKLDTIDSLYPADRLAASKERWRRLWDGRNPEGRLPWVAEPFTIDYYVAGLAKEELLQRYLDEFIARGFVQDDFIPAFFPGCKQSTIPNMFGAKDVCVCDDWTCERIVDESSDIFALPEPSICPGSVASEWLEIERYFLEETEGRVPIHVTDMQGPADVCGQLWGYENLFAAAYTDPQAYWEIMDRATRAFVLLWEAQHELVGRAFVGTHLFGWSWIPEGMGVSVSADSLVMISPAFYEEFYLPSMERLSSRFGGLILHSCGDFAAVVPAICKTQGLRAINAGEMEISDLIKAGVGRDVLMIARSGIDEIPDKAAMFRDGWRMDQTVTGIWPGDRKPLSDWNAEDLQDVLGKMETVNEALQF